MKSPPSPDNPDAPIVILTAGAGGMYCGSCLHDNTLATTLTRQGANLLLVPTYTPLRTDGDDMSIDQLFMGGINVYLQQKLPLLQYLPGFFDRWLDHPKLIQWAAGRGMQLSANELGPLTVSMLRGKAGNQRKEVKRLCKWLASIGPRLVSFSNILIAGCLPQVKAILGVPTVVTLQGDDIFLDNLLPEYREQAMVQIRTIAQQVDLFLVHSQYYAEYMGARLEIPRDKIEVVPLGIDTDFFAPPIEAADDHAIATVGYLARLAPEKGLRELCLAFSLLYKQLGGQARLRIAGWLGEEHREYAENALQQVRDDTSSDAVEYLGAVDRERKREFLHSVHVLSVPSPYPDPKGIYILEALACGVPVVAPNHGAFPELLAATDGGLLFPPGNIAELASQLRHLLSDRQSGNSLAQSGRENTVQRHSASVMARRVWQAYGRLLFDLPTLE